MRVPASRSLSLCFLLLSMALSGQDAGGSSTGLEAWILGNAELSAYRPQAALIAEALAPALEAGVPLAVVRSRILEAAAKKAPADKALEALRRDARDLSLIAGLIGETAWPPAPERQAFYQAAAAALRNGLGDDALKAMFRRAASQALDPRRASSCLATAAAVRRILPAEDGEAAAFATVLAASKVPADKVASFASLAAMARSAGMGASEFYAETGRALAAGRSFAAIERTIKGKVKR